jgi:hypothetical protein
MNWLRRWMANWRSRAPRPIRRVIVLLLDGLEPALVDHYLEQGLLHYLALLSDVGLRTVWRESAPVDLDSWKAIFREHRVGLAVLPTPSDSKSGNLMALAAADRRQQENLLTALGRKRSGVVVAAFDMARHLQQLLSNEPDENQRQVARDVYARMDEIVGKAFSFVDDRTVLIAVALRSPDPGLGKSTAGGILFASCRSEAFASLPADLPRLVLHLLSVDSLGE